MKTILPVLFILAPLLSHAESGFYVGGGLGLTHYDHDDFFDTGALIGGSFDDDSVGAKLIGGYQINNWLSTEASYNYLGYYLEEGTGANDDDDIETSLSALTLSLVLHAPVSQQVKLFGQLGAGLGFVSQYVDYDNGIVDFEESESDTGPAGQLGLGIMVNIPQLEGLQIRAGYERFFIETDLYNVSVANALVSDEVDQRIDKLYVGATYRF